MSADRPMSPDAAWVDSLKVGSEVVVIEPIPWRAVYIATVTRITPTGILRLAHKSGDAAETFRPTGYKLEPRRGWGFSPRFIISPEALAALGESIR